MRLVVIARPEAPHLSVLNSLPSAVEVFVAPEPDPLLSKVGEADVILNGSHHGATLAALWPHAKKLHWVHSLSAGVENIVFPELRESAIPLTNSRGVYKRSLGEFALLGMLYFAKDVRRMERQQSAANWEPYDIDEIRGATCVVLSYGEIGREVAWRAKAMGMTVIATRRNPGSGKDDIATEIVSPDRTAEAMGRADYVVCCSPLTPETRKMLGDREFRVMKPTGVFINIGRGAVVDEAALIAVLRERRIRGAALDVFETEPLPKDSEFWKLDNVLLSPHCADHTATWQHEGVRFFVENFERFVKGEPLQNIVDKKAGY